MPQLKRKGGIKALGVLLGLSIIVLTAAVMTIFWPKPRPAEFVFSDLTVTPIEALAGELVTVKVCVKNIGEVEGDCTVTLMINGVKSDAENITVLGGARRDVTFYVRKNEAGIYDISVDGLHQRLTVRPRLIAISPEEPKVPTAQEIVRHYEWSFKGMRYTWDISIPGELYTYYRGRTRPPTKDYSIYVTHPKDDECIKSLEEAVNRAALRGGFTEVDKINFVIRFVQSLPYTPDNVTTPFDEYPRYPIETLVDNGGDCEDTSILMAALLDEMGYDVVLIALPEHMAVGISGPFYGSYYLFENRKYFYLETTGKGWEIGEVPKEFEGKPAHLYPIKPVPILTHSWDARYITFDIIELTVTVKNEGTAIARDASVYAGFDAGENKLWNPGESDRFTLPSDSKANVVLRLNVPKGKYTRLVVQIAHGGYAVDTSYSKWFNT